MLLSAGAYAGALPPPQSAPSSAREQAQDAQTRGVPVPAAADAAAPQVASATPEQAATAQEANTTTDPAAASIVPAPSPVAGMRGVLFRIIPPAATLWALVARSRWSTAILAAAAFAIAIMVWRMAQIWFVQVA